MSTKVLQKRTRNDTAYHDKEAEAQARDDAAAALEQEQAESAMIAAASHLWTTIADFERRLGRPRQVLRLPPCHATDPATADEAVALLGWTYATTRPTGNCQNAGVVESLMQRNLADIDRSYWPKEREAVVKLAICAAYLVAPAVEALVSRKNRADLDKFVQNLSSSPSGHQDTLDADLWGRNDTLRWLARALDRPIFTISADAPSTSSQRQPTGFYVYIVGQHEAGIRTGMPTSMSFAEWRSRLDQAIATGGDPLLMTYDPLHYRAILLPRAQSVGSTDNGGQSPAPSAEVVDLRSPSSQASCGAPNANAPSTMASQGVETSSQSSQAPSQESQGAVSHQIKMDRLAIRRHGGARAEELEAFGQQAVLGPLREPILSHLQATQQTQQTWTTDYLSEIARARTNTSIEGARQALTAALHAKLLEDQEADDDRNSDSSASSDEAYDANDAQLPVPRTTAILQRRPNPSSNSAPEPGLHRARHWSAGWFRPGSRRLRRQWQASSQRLPQTHMAGGSACPRTREPRCWWDRWLGRHSFLGAASSCLNTRFLLCTT